MIKQMRAGSMIGVVALFVVLGLYGGNKNPDTSDPDNYRTAAFQVMWAQFGDTKPPVDFIYNVGLNKGSDHSSVSPFSVVGAAQRGARITIFAGVRDLDRHRVGKITCQGYVDGNPVKTDVELELGKWIRCGATVVW